MRQVIYSGCISTVSECNFIHFFLSTFSLIFFVFQKTLLQGYYGAKDRKLYRASCLFFLIVFLNYKTFSNCILSKEWYALRSDHECDLRFDAIIAYFSPCAEIGN